MWEEQAQLPVSPDSPFREPSLGMGPGTCLGSPRFYGGGEGAGGGALFRLLSGTHLRTEMKHFESEDSRSFGIASGSMCAEAVQIAILDSLTRL